MLQDLQVLEQLGFFLTETLSVGGEKTISWDCVLAFSSAPELCVPSGTLPFLFSRILWASSMPALHGHLLFRLDFGSRRLCIYVLGLWVSPSALSSPRKPSRPDFPAALNSASVYFYSPYLLTYRSMCPSASQGDPYCHSCLPGWGLAQEVPFVLDSFFPHPTKHSVPARPLAWVCPRVLFFHCGQTTWSPPALRCI